MVYVITKASSYQTLVTEHHEYLDSQN